MSLHLNEVYKSMAAWNNIPIISSSHGLDTLGGTIARLFLEDGHVDDPFVLMQTWIDEWVGPASIEVELGQRVANVMTHIEHFGIGAIDRSGMANLVGLSPSRFAAVFAADVGVSLTRYLLGLRVMAALRAIAHGESVTSVAVTTGFSDGAHLTRSCRSFYGWPPSFFAACQIQREDISKAFEVSI